MWRQHTLQNRMIMFVAIWLAMLNACQVQAQCDIEWSPFISTGEQIGVNNWVYATTEWNGDLIAGGIFTTAGGQTVNCIARWDGSVWHPFTSGGQIGVDGSVRALTVWNGDLIAGGYFTTAGGQAVNGVARWNGSSWQSFTSGGQIGTSGGTSGGGNAVYALTVWNNDLIAGGNFTAAGGQPVNGIARWDGSAWHPFISGGQIGVGGSLLDVFALTVWNSGLVAGGYFTTAGGQQVNGIARWNGSSWQSISSGGQIGLDGSVYALTLWNGDLIAGGDFPQAGGQPVNLIARWNGSSWSPLAIGINNGWVNALTAWGGDLIAGGNFTAAGGQDANRIARWDGSAWHSFTADRQNGVDSPVYATTVWSGDLIAGGYFTEAGGQTVNHIARWGILDGGEQYWVGPPGGSGNYHVAAHWLCGFEPIAVASVVFDSTVVPIAPAYAVSLTKDVLVRRIIARTDDITFNLTNHNVFLTAAHSDPRSSLIVGEYADEDTRLTVRNSLASPRRLYATSLSIGDGENSIGQLTVRNTTQVSPLSAGLTADGNITLGRLGHGTLIVENRADVAYGIDGSQVRIGDGAQGSLTVRSGGQLLGEEFIDTVTIGKQPNTSGAVLIDGLGSTWISACNSFFIGESGDASLTISNGGALYSTTLSQLRLASNAGSTALVTVTGMNSIWSEGIQPIVLGGNGSATLTVHNSGMIESLNVNNLRNGTVRGDGMIFSDMFNLGNVEPVQANGDPATLTIEGNYRQIGPPPGGSSDESGRLRIKVNESSASSLLVSGTAELGGGLYVDVLQGKKLPGGSLPVLNASVIHLQHSAFDVAYLPALAGKFMKVNYPSALNDGPASVTLTVEDLTTLLSFNSPAGPDDLAGTITAAVVGNFNGDQFDDLAITITNGDQQDGALLVFLSAGGGAFQGVQQYPTGIQPSAITVGNFDNDGSLDIAVANRLNGVGPGSVRVYSNAAAGTFFSQLGSDITVGINPSSIASGDLRDSIIGVDDILVANTDSDNVAHILNNNGVGFLLIPIFIPTPPRPIIVKSRDIDVNRDIDFSVLTDQVPGVTTFLNDGVGNFPANLSATYPVADDPRDMHIVDLNDDGQPDIVTANLSGDVIGGTVSVLVNTGTSGVYAPAVNLPIDGTQPYSIVAANLDHVIDPQPGQPDLIDLAVLVENGIGGSEIRILRNDTTTATVALTLLEDVNAAPDGSIVLLTGDIDGVNGPDLLAISETSSPLNGMNDGDGVAAMAGPPSPLRLLLNDGGDPRPVCRADIAPAPPNGDGNVGVPDLLAVINAWGPCVNPNNCAADIAPLPNGDGAVGVPDLLAIINAWGQCPQ